MTGGRGRRMYQPTPGSLMGYQAQQHAHAQQAQHAHSQQAAQHAQHAQQQQQQAAAAAAQAAQQVLFRRAWCP